MTDAASAPDEPKDPLQRLDLADEIFHRPGAGGDVQLLERVIALLAPVIGQVPRKGLKRARAVLLLTNALMRKFEATSDIESLDCAETVLRDDSTLFPQRSDGQSRYLSTASWITYRRAQHTESAQTLEKAMAAAKRGYARFPHKAEHHENLARVLLLHHERTAQRGSLDSSVQHYLRAVSLTPAPGVERASRLDGLANALDRVASATSDEQDLCCAVQAHRDAVASLTEQDLNEATVLSNLGIVLQHSYERTGALPDLAEAIDLHRRAMQMTNSPKDIQYATRVEGLANALMYLFEARQAPEILAEAIEVRRQALEHLLVGDPIRKSCQANLSASLYRRFERTGDTESLAEAEQRLRELVADPDLRGRPKAIRTNALGAVLCRRGLNGGGTPADLEEACSYLAEAIEEAETACLEHVPMIRANLAAAYLDRYAHAGDEGLLNKAIGLYRHAISDTSQTHSERGARVANLAHALITQARDQQDVTRLDEADAACAEVLRDLVPDDPAHARCLTIAADAKRCRFELTSQRVAAVDALSLYELAARHTPSPVTFRIQAARSGGILAGTIGEFEAAFSAYTDAVGLVERAVSPALSPRDQEGVLAALEGLPRDAAAMAIAAGRPDQAVVLLEQARSVLLGRAAETRTDYDMLRRDYPELAEELKVIQQELDAVNPDVATPTDENAPAHTRSTADRRARLALRYEDVLSRIRACPGLVEFYKPIPIVQLRTAAAAGPVIIVNVSSYRCDALVVHADRIQVIELPDLSAEDVADRAGRFLTATDSGSSGDLNDVIVWTWESIAEPVLRELGVTGPPRDGERVPRIWWCPTGMATFLPFHAAGNHVRESSETPRSVLDWTASSYTSTLRALFRLGEMPERSESSRHEMLVVKVASSRIAPDAPPLTGVERDVELLKERFLGLTVLEDDNATCEEVLRAMRSHSRVHFACHGLQDLENPSDGHLALYDERLTIRRIAQQHLPPGELAFVSACETFRAGRSIPDEGTTLAAALQLVGYRHVVATHWKLFGGLTEQVASAFYDTAAVERSEGDPPALEGVAEALRAAMLRAREESDYAPPLYWAPYIHVGP